MCMLVLTSSAVIQRTSNKNISRRRLVHIYANTFSLLTSAEDIFVPLVLLSVKWDKELHLLYRVEELVQLIVKIA